MKFTQTITHILIAAVLVFGPSVSVVEAKSVVTDSNSTKTYGYRSYFNSAKSYKPASYSSNDAFDAQKAKTITKDKKFPDVTSYIDTYAKHDVQKVTPQEKAEPKTSVKYVPADDNDYKAYEPAPGNDQVARCNSFYVVEPFVDQGETIMLKWETTGVSNVSINRGVGSVAVDGSIIVAAPTNPGTYEYVLTFDGQTSSRCRDSVKVLAVPVSESLTCSGVVFNASDRSVDEGDDIELAWSWTQSYDRVRISNGVGTVDNNDEETIEINSDETYTLSVTRDGVTKDCKTIAISARENNSSSGGGSSNPRCQYFEASDETITAGDRVVLSWETSRTEEITLYEGSVRRGDEIFSTDDEDDVDEGEFVVRPTKDTTYTLHLERGSRDRTCTVEVEVEDEDREDVVVLSDRTLDPLVAGIALVDAPYTGFDAGSAVTYFFYLVLAAWGLFMVYSFTGKRRYKSRPATGVLMG